MYVIFRLLLFSTFQVIVPKTKEVKKSKAKKAKSSNKKAAAKPKNVKKAATKPVKKLAAITRCGSGFSYTLDYGKFWSIIFLKNFVNAICYIIKSSQGGNL